MVLTSGILVMAALILGVPPAMADGRASRVAQAEAGATQAPTPAEPPTPAPAPPPEPTPSPPEPEQLPDPLHPQPESWLDTGHSALAEGLFWPVERFDRFFSDEREVDSPRPSSFIRWRNDLKIRADGTLGYGTTLRADLRFPNLSRRLHRLRLTLSGDTREALETTPTPGEPPLPATSSGRLSAGLRYDLLEGLATQADLQGGLLVRWPVGLFTRLRLRHVQPVDGIFQVRTSSAGFWQTTTGWGVRQDVDLERPLGEAMLLRLADNATLTQKSRGAEWQSELSLLRTFGTTSAVSLMGSASGATDSGPVVETYRLATRVRWEAFRHWIFLELEPEGVWTRPVGGGRQRRLAVILRVELQFDEAKARLP